VRRTEITTASRASQSSGGRLAENLLVVAREVTELAEAASKDSVRGGRFENRVYSASAARASVVLA